MLLVGKQFTFRIEIVGDRAMTVNLQLPLKTSTPKKGSN